MNSKVIIRYIVTPIIFALIVGAVVLIGGNGLKGIAFGSVEKAFILGSPEIGFTKDYKGKFEPTMGKQYGIITSKDVKLKAPLIYGDTDDVFERGAGQYIGGGKPGDGKTILVGGHDLSFFAPLEKIKKGNIIEVSTSYGEYKYEVTGTKVAKANDLKATKLGDKGERLVIYTCYPFGKVLGSRDERFFVYAKEVSND